MKFPIKTLLVLALNPDGMTYKQLSEKTSFHLNTVSRQVSYLHNKGLITIRQAKSNSVRGRKWINIAKLKKEIFENKVIDFFAKVAKQLNCSLNDLFVN